MALALPFFLTQPELFQFMESVDACMVQFAPHGGFWYGRKATTSPIARARTRLRAAIGRFDVERRTNSEPDFSAPIKSKSLMLDAEKPHKYRIQPPLLGNSVTQTATQTCFQCTQKIDSCSDHNFFLLSSSLNPSQWCVSLVSIRGGVLARGRIFSCDAVLELRAGVAHATVACHSFRAL